MKDDFEEQRRKKFFKKMNEKKKIIQELINESRKVGRKLGIDSRPNNVARIVFKKISTDIVPQFKKVGLNFYSNSVVTTAIQKQLLVYVDDAQGLLEEYNENLINGRNNIAQREIREESVKVGQNKLSKYDCIESKIEDYNLRGNIIDAIMNVLCPDNGLMQLGLSVPKLINRDIAPTLNRLGLGDLVPKLKQRLVERNQEESYGTIIAPEASIPYYGEQVEERYESTLDEDVLALDDKL